jgi:hypothetical protein
VSVRRRSVNIAAAATFELRRGERMNDLEAASVRALYDEHGAALWRYAVRLIGDGAHAEASTSTAKPVTGEPGLVRDEEAIARAHQGHTAS